MFVSRRLPPVEPIPVKAFLSLHQYMELSSVTKVLSTLLTPPHNTLLTDGDQLSVYGRAVLTILTEAMAPENLPHVHLHSLAALYPSCHSSQLEDFLLQVGLRIDIYDLGICFFYKGLPDCGIILKSATKHDTVAITNR